MKIYLRNNDGDWITANQDYLSSLLCPSPKERMNRQALAELLQQVIAALESSVPNTPSTNALAKHWNALDVAQQALRNLSDSKNTSKTK